MNIAFECNTHLYLIILACESTISKKLPLFFKSLIGNFFVCCYENNITQVFISHNFSDCIEDSSFHHFFLRSQTDNLGFNCCSNSSQDGIRWRPSVQRRNSFCYQTTTLLIECLYTVVLKLQTYNVFNDDISWIWTDLSTFRGKNL